VGEWVLQILEQMRDMLALLVVQVGLAVLVVHLLWWLEGVPLQAIFR